MWYVEVEALPALPDIKSEYKTVELDVVDGHDTWDAGSHMSFIVPMNGGGVPLDDSSVVVVRVKSDPKLGAAVDAVL